MTNKEIEYKTLVTKNQFDRLINIYKPEISIIETNYYFDDDNNSIKNRNLSLRIREINKQYICTIKETIDKNTKLEHEFISSELNLTNNPEISNFLIKFNIDVSKLKIKGSLTTYRHIHNTKNGELCFDENHYNNQIDYEIEFEQTNYSSNFYQEFLDILKKADITYQPAKSKTFRCLNTIVQDIHN